MREKCIANNNSVQTESRPPRRYRYYSPNTYRAGNSVTKLYIYSLIIKPREPARASCDGTRFDNIWGGKYKVASS